jgi:UDP-N-acetyl-2-amino-2-deoxyglucuronate dehydrogenase
MNLLKFAIIGVGNIAPLHAAAIKATPKAELVATATRNPARGAAFVKEQGGKWYADYRDLLAREEVDVIAICTPHDLHLPMALDAAAAHKHLLIEKPLARNTAECDGIIAACEQAGVTLGVLFQMRHDPLARKLKALIDEGKLGELIWTTTNALWYRTDEYYRTGVWRGSWEHEGGGVLINQAIHVIDLMLWLTGTPTRVDARMRTLNHDIETEDAAIAMLEYASKRLGLIQATVAAYPGYPERLDIIGTRGSAIYHRGQARLEWHIADPREDGEEQSEASSGAGAPMSINASGHIAAYQDFTAAVREHRAPLVDGREGRRSVELIEAIYRSARANAPATLA